MHSKPLEYSWSVVSVKHVDDHGITCFTADATVRDIDGKAVATLVGNRRHAYVEAAEDEAIDAARMEIRRIRSSASQE